MPRGFRFIEFQYFFEVANSHSIRRAADALNVSPSAVSRQVQKVEHLIGAKVIEQGTQGIRLTAAGEELLEHVRQCFADEERLFARLDEIAGLRRGLVRIVCGDGFLPDFLGAAFETFSNEHPGISFDIRVIGSDGIVKTIVEDEAELGMIFYPPTDNGIATLARHSQPLHAVMSPDHQLAKERCLSLDQVNEFPLALPTLMHGIRQVISSVAHEKRIQLAPRFTSNSVYSLKVFAEKYGAVTLLPAFAAMPQLELGILVEVPLLENRFQSTHAELIAKRGKELSVAALKFVDVLKEGTRALTGIT